MDRDGQVGASAVIKLLMWSGAHLDNRVLELTLGSRVGIRVIFASMSRPFVPAAA
jgi:hypothetical protein